MTIWSGQQRQALDGVGRWINDENAAQVKIIDGYAGTGKTTLARHLVDNADGHWLYAAFTGKAALVMRQRGCHGARTIHSLIYRPNGEKKDQNIADMEHQLAIARDEEQKILASLPPLPEKKNPDVMGVDFARVGASWKRERDPEFMAAHARVAELEQRLLLARRSERRQPAFQLWAESPLRNAPGVVIDEGSMVDEEVGADLLSFGKKILVLMDTAQLPPVGAVGMFARMEPDYRLTEVHRQARESGILDLATYVREGGDIMARASARWITSDCHTGLRGDVHDLRERVLAADQVICGKNTTRHACNRRHRELAGRGSPWPERGDKLICLRNDRNVGLMNGGMWRTRSAVRDESARTVCVEMLPDDRFDDEVLSPTIVTTWDHHFISQEKDLREMGYRRNDEQELDYGYAVTCHKAQGSQWGDVVVFDESRVFKGAEMQRRWLYTAITRASRKLTVIV